MIFITVGTQLPFDRLIKGLDRLPYFSSHEALAQIGTGATYIPQNIDYEKNLSQLKFQEAFEMASVIISHSGIGTVLTAQRLGKPLIVFPRMSAFKEHRNDHQIATTKQLESIHGIYCTRTIDEIDDLLKKKLQAPNSEQNKSLEKLQRDINNYAK